TVLLFVFQAEDGIRDKLVTGVQTCALPILNVDLGAMFHTPSGLYYEDMAIGTGDPARRGSRVTVQYIGWLPDGTMFDRSDPNAQIGRASCRERVWIREAAVAAEEKAETWQG